MNNLPDAVGVTTLTALTLTDLFNETEAVATVQADPLLDALMTLARTHDALNSDNEQAATFVASWITFGDLARPDPLGIFERLRAQDPITAGVAEQQARRALTGLAVMLAEGTG